MSRKTPYRPWENFPLPPERLDAMAEVAPELMRSLEETLLENIAKRVSAANNLNEVALENVRALRASGKELEEVKAMIARETRKTRQQIDDLFQDALDRNRQYYDYIIDQAELTKPRVYLDQDIIDSIRRQTEERFDHITASMGFAIRQNGKLVSWIEPADAYNWALDQATIAVESGAITYGEAIARATKQLADSGIRTIEWDNKNGQFTAHTDSVDVAVRRAVLTGLTQLTGRYSESMTDQLETDLVETSAHQGARNFGGLPENHAEWQGRVFHWAEKGDRHKGKYPDFIESTGYGTGAGLCGWNCRHLFYPFVDGVTKRTYTDEQLKALDTEFDYKGKRYTTYQATQEQRRIERTVRKIKREQAAATDKATENSCRAMIRALRKEYRDFSAAAGLKTQEERMMVLYD